jgi:hypothetical protein
VYSGIVVHDRIRRVLAVSTACPQGVVVGIGRLFHQSKLWGTAPPESLLAPAAGASTEARACAADWGVCACAAAAASSVTAMSEALPRERREFMRRILRIGVVGGARGAAGVLVALTYRGRARRARIRPRRDAQG